MAEATGLRNNALPYPIYGAPWGVVFPMLDADGDLVTGATTPDAEVSKNGDTFADCTNESTEIATNSGIYYLLLTGTEMTADVVAVIAKSATAGMKTTAMTFYPRKLVTIRSGTSASGGVSTSTIVLDASASAVDDFYNGMVCIATIDSNVEVRVITDYTGSTQTATVSPDWNVAPDNNDTFVIKLPEGVQINQANVTLADGVAVQAASGRFQVDAELVGGLTPETAASIADAVWDEDMTAHQTQGTAGQTLGDSGGSGASIWTQLDTNLDQAVSNVSTDVMNEIVEGTTTVVESLRLANGANGGNTTGMDSGNPRVRDLANTKDRVTATSSSSGRTVSARDLT